MRSSQGEPRAARLSAPVLVWPFVAALSVVLFLASLPAFNRYNSGTMVFQDAAAKRLAGLPSRDGRGEEGLRAVALGSSLFARALFFDSKMEELAKIEDLGGLEFVRITRPNAELSDFSPLLDEIIKAGPDVVYIESDSVFHDRRDEGFLNKYREFLRAMLMESLKAKRPLIPAPEKPYIDNESDFPEQVMDRAMTLKAALERWKRTPLAPADEVEAFFSELSKCGIRVVLVRMPRSPEFERLSQGLDTAGGLMERLRDSGVEQASLRTELGDEYFLDHAHLNDRGRLEFSRWLVGDMKKAGEMKKAAAP